MAAPIPYTSLSQRQRRSGIGNTGVSSLYPYRYVHPPYPNYPSPCDVASSARVVNLSRPGGAARLHPLVAPLSGLGNTQQVIVAAPQIAGSVLTAGGTSSIAASLWGEAAIPVVGAAVAAVTVALMLFFGRKGPQQKIATTEIVNALEPQLKANVIGYLQGPRTVTSQQQALANFDAVWSALVSRCETPANGNPGTWCVQDRQAGSCKWTRGQGDPLQQYDGVLPGECWNWFKGYRDPIANDIPVPDTILPPAAQQTLDDTILQINQILTGSSGDSSFLLMGAGVLLLIAAMGGSH